MMFFDVKIVASVIQGIMIKCKLEVLNVCG